MPDDTSNLGVNVYGLDDIDKLAAGVVALSKTIDELGLTSAQYGKKGELLSATVKKTADDGTQLQETLKRVGGAFKQVGIRIDETIKKQKELLLATEKQRKAFADSARVAVPEDATAEEALKYRKALQDASRVLKGNEGDLKEIQTIFKQLSRGEIPKYTGRLGDAQIVLERLVKAQNQLGESQRRANAELKRTQEIQRQRKDFAAGQRANIPEGTTNTEFLRYRKAVEEASRFIRGGRNDFRDLQRIANEVASGTMKQYTGELSKAQRLAVALVEAKSNLGAETRKVAEAEKRAQALAERRRTLESQLRVPVPSTATGKEFIEYRRAIQAVTKELGENEFDLRQIQEILAEINRGELKQYDARWTRVQQSLGRVLVAQNQLGASARKLAAEQKAALEATNFASQSQFQQVRFLDPRQTNTFNRAMETVRKTIQKHNLTAKQANEIYRSLASGGMKNLSAGATKLQNDLIRLREAANGTVQSSRQLLVTWQTLFRILTVSVAYRALFVLQDQINQAIRTSIELSGRIAEIQTIAPPTESFQEWLSVIRELADEFSIDILDQAEAAYQSLSNQIINTTQEARVFLSTVNALAAITRSTAAQSVNALSSSMNSFGLSVAESEVEAARLFKTVELGRLRLADMSDSLGNVAILAAQVGLSSAELEAALATLTIQGLKAPEAMTQIRGILIKLIQPTKATTKLFKDLNLETGSAAIQSLGFAGFLEVLQERTRGSEAELIKYINRIRGVSGALGLTGKNLELFRRNLQEIENASKEAEFGRSFEEALDLVLNSTGKRLTIELERIRNFFVTDIGLPFLEVIRSWSNEFALFTDLIKSGTKAFVALAAAVPFTLVVLGIIEARAAFNQLWRTGSFVLKSLTAQAIGLRVAMRGVVLALVAIAIAAGYALIDFFVVTANERLEKSRKELDEARKAQANILKEQAREYGKQIDEARKRLRILSIESGREIVKKLLDLSQARIGFEDDVNTLVKTLTSAFSGIVDGFTASIQQAERLIERSEERIQSLNQQIEDAIRAFEDIGRSGDQKLFNLELDLLEGSPDKQIQLLRKEIQRLQAEAQNQVNLLGSTSDPEEQVRIINRINTLLSDRNSLEDRIGGIIRTSGAIQEASLLLANRIKAATQEQLNIQQQIELIQTRRRDEEIAELARQKQIRLEQEKQLESLKARLDELKNFDPATLDNLFDVDTKELDALIENLEDTIRGLLSSPDVFDPGELVRAQQELQDLFQQRTNARIAGQQRNAEALLTRYQRLINELKRAGADPDIIESIRDQQEALRNRLQGRLQQEADTANLQTAQALNNLSETVAKGVLGIGVKIESALTGLLQSPTELVQQLRAELAGFRIDMARRLSLGSSAPLAISGIDDASLASKSLFSGLGLEATEIRELATAIQRLSLAEGPGNQLTALENIRELLLENLEVDSIAELLKQIASGERTGINAPQIEFFKTLRLTIKNLEEIQRLQGPVQAIEAFRNSIDAATKLNLDRLEGEAAFTDSAIQLRGAAEIFERAVDEFSRRVNPGSSRPSGPQPTRSSSIAPTSGEINIGLTINNNGGTSLDPTAVADAVRRGVRDGLIRLS